MLVRRCCDIVHQITVAMSTAIEASRTAGVSGVRAVDALIEKRHGSVRRLRKLLQLYAPGQAVDVIIASVLTVCSLPQLHICNLHVQRMQHIWLTGPCTDPHCWKTI